MITNNYIYNETLRKINLKMLGSTNTSFFNWTDAGVEYTFKNETLQISGLIFILFWLIWNWTISERYVKCYV